MQLLYTSIQLKYKQYNRTCTLLAFVNFFKCILKDRLVDKRLSHFAQKKVGFSTSITASGKANNRIMGSNVIR